MLFHQSSLPYLGLAKERPKSGAFTELQVHLSLQILLGQGKKNRN